MTRIASRFPCIEVLEARIAPAISIVNAPPDILVGPGKTGASIDLSRMTVAATPSPYHTIVKFTTNVDGDSGTAGVQGDIVIELFDQEAPRTVQNFLRYVENLNSVGDYDGTFFHRIADFGSGSAAGTDIIQGGGFNSGANAADFTHIPVFNEVFNEFTSTLPNVRGTLALAKTAQGPSTGTSEWFVNVHDNTDILGGTNNGGFAVFGKVLSGMGVVDKIAALTSNDLRNVVGNGAFGEVPLQPGYVSGIPSPDQLVRVIDATVVPPTPAATSLTYTIDHITNVKSDGTATTVPSTLVKGSIANGTQLNLTYAKGKSGLADVTVKVTDGTETKFDTFRVDLRGNLFANDLGAQLLIPGDTPTLTYNVINDGAAAITGSAKVVIKFKRIDPGAPATTFDAPDQTVSLNVPAGGSQLLKLKIPVPKNAAIDPDEAYQVSVKITKLAGERTDADNTSTGGSHRLVNAFGAIDGRTNVILKYQKNGSVFSWSMKGPGAGQLIPADGNHLSLETFNTTVASILTATSSLPAVHTSLDSIQFDDPLATANLGAVDVVGGPVVASSGVKSLTLGNLTGQSLMLIGELLSDITAKTTLKFGNVTDYSIESGMPVTSLTATYWHDDSGVHDAITVPSLGMLKVNGNFSADVSIGESTIPTAIAITGKVFDSDIHSDGNFGAVTVGAFSESSLFAGVDARPVELADLASAGNIASFTIKPVATVSDSLLFVNSQVAAKTIGTINVQRVQAANTGAFGFVADTIKSYTRLSTPASIPSTGAMPGKFAASNLTGGLFDDHLNPTTQSQYRVRVLPEPVV